MTKIAASERATVGALPGQSCRAPIDLTQAVRNSLGSHDLARRVLDRFAYDLMADVRELAEAAMQVNIERLCFLSHAMRGAASVCGAEQLRSMIAQLEETSAGVTRCELVSRVGGIHDEALRCVQYIERFLSGTGPSIQETKDESADCR